MKHNEIKSLSIMDLLITIAKKKKVIIITALIISVLSVVYVLIVPQYWVSKAAIKPISDDQGFNLSGALMGLGSSFLGGSVTTSSTEFVSVMNSRTFSEDVVKQFDLGSYFKLSKKDSFQILETATKLLQKRIMSFYVSPETGIIHIYAETKDRLLSKAIVDYYVKKIEEYNKTVQKSKGRQKRIFLEKRVKEIELKIEEIKLAMQIFQQSNNVLEVDAQISGAIELYTSLLTKKLELELEIIAYREIYAEDSLKLKTLELTLKELNDRISDLEKGSDYKYILGFESIPELAKNYSGLITQLEINKTLFEFLFPQLEAAKLEEIKDLPSLEIIDPGSIAGYRSKPKRAQFCIIMFFASILVASTFIVVKHYTPAEQEEKIRRFWKLLFSKNDLKS